MTETSTPRELPRREALRIFRDCIVVGTGALTAACTPLDLAKFALTQGQADLDIPRRDQPDTHDQKRSEWLMPSDIRILLPKTWNTWHKGELPVPSERLKAVDLHHLVVHHTALKLTDLSVVDQLQALCRADGQLPYHVVIGPDGVVYAREQSGISRMDSVGVAPHAGGIMNHAAMGVCLLGNYEAVDWQTRKKLPTDAATEKALRSLAYVLAQLQHQYAIKPKYGNDIIIPHRGVASLLNDKNQATDCPGSLIMEKWDGVMREVHSVLTQAK